MDWREVIKLQWLGLLFVTIALAVCVTVISREAMNTHEEEEMI